MSTSDGLPGRLATLLKGEPVMIAATVLAAVLVGLEAWLGGGDVNEAVLAALMSLMGGVIARSQVTPVSRLP